MARKALAPSLSREGDSLAGRLEWLCHAVHAECACAAEDRVSAGDAWERQLDLALDCYAHGDDAAAFAISDRLDEHMRAWAAGKEARPESQAGDPAAREARGTG